MREAAANPNLDRRDRAKAIFSLFCNHLKPVQDVANMRAVLQGAPWLANKSHIQLIGPVGGWIPLEWKPDSTCYRCYLFPNEDGWSDWVIYFRLEYPPLPENPDLSGALATFLKGKQSAVNPKLVEFALCFPDHWIERYRKSGLAAGEYPE